MGVLTTLIFLQTLTFSVPHLKQFVRDAETIYYNTVQYTHIKFNYSDSSVTGEVTSSDNASDLYLGSARFDSRPEHQLSSGFCGLPQSLQENAAIVPLLGHDHFLPNSYQFVTHQSSYSSALYCPADGVVN